MEESPQEMLKREANTPGVTGALIVVWSKGTANLRMSWRGIPDGVIAQIPFHLQRRISKLFDEMETDEVIN